MASVEHILHIEGLAKVMNFIGGTWGNIIEEYLYSVFYTLEKFEKVDADGAGK